MNLYIVTAFRYGDFEMHSYSCGVFSTLEAAQLAGLREDLWRSGKYKAHIEEVELDKANIMNMKHVNNFWWVDPEDFTPAQISEAWNDVGERSGMSKRNK